MPSLFETPAEAPVPFAGAEFAEADRPRLTKQLDCILELVRDEKWRTVQKLTAELRRRHPKVNFPENSVQAQLRNLRKAPHRLNVERRNVAQGGSLFEYRVLPASEAANV